MARRPASPEDAAHGRRLGAHLGRVRGESGRSAQTVASEAQVSIDTVRSVETGRVPTPAFLTVARLAAALGQSLDELHEVASSEAARDVRAGSERDQ